MPIETKERIELLALIRETHRNLTELRKRLAPDCASGSPPYPHGMHFHMAQDSLEALKGKIELGGG